MPKFYLVGGDTHPAVYADDNAAAVEHGQLVAVIDFEDMEQVERLAMLIRDAAADDWIGSTQAALREFANPTPPKPEEPTGLGAVVEDAEGKRWLRIGVPADGLLHAWAPHGNVGSLNWTNYAAINVVRVLSEGVTA